MSKVRSGKCLQVLYLYQLPRWKMEDGSHGQVLVLYHNNKIATKIQMHMFFQSVMGTSMYDRGCRGNLEYSREMIELAYFAS